MTKLFEEIKLAYIVHHASWISILTVSELNTIKVAVVVCAILCCIIITQLGDLPSEEMFRPAKLREIFKLRGFKIVHQNIRSLRCKIDKVRVIVNEVKMGLHLTASTETWSNELVSDAELQIPGYICLEGIDMLTVVELQLC